MTSQFNNYFTQEQILELKNAFASFDQDKDGSITIPEFKLLLKYLGHMLTKMELEELLIDFKESHKTLITYTEFLKLMSKIGRDTDMEDELMEVFKVFETEKQGTLTGLDLKNMMTQFGDKINEEEADNILREAEIELDQEVDYETLIKFALSK